MTNDSTVNYSLGPEWRSSTNMKRITRLFVFSLWLLFGLPVQANNDRPMFMRATLLEAEGIEGPFDATIYIQLVHRSPSWYPNQDISLGQITLGEPSP